MNPPIRASPSSPSLLPTSSMKGINTTASHSCFPSLPFPPPHLINEGDQHHSLPYSPPSPSLLPTSSMKGSTPQPPIFPSIPFPPPHLINEGDQHHSLPYSPPSPSLLPTSSMKGINSTVSHSYFSSLETVHRYI